jgi:catechol 2,3-dioxygenase-like lactoylglutathione lyase family enzyme
MRRVLLFRGLAGQPAMYLTLLAGPAVIFAQAPQPAAQATAPVSDLVVGSRNFSPIVRDIEKTLSFYRDVIGLTVPPNIPMWGNDPALLAFLGVPGAQLRVATPRIPGSAMAIEIVEFKDIDRKPAQVRMQDPGAARLILFVRNIDVVFARAQQAGVPVVTTGGLPVMIAGANGKGRAVVLKDPDGFFIELVQADPLPDTTAPAESNVIGSRFGLTIADTDQLMKVYRDVLGFQLEASDFSVDKSVNDLMGTPGAQIRRTTTQVPGSTTRMEFLEFKGIERKPIGAHIQDPGAARFHLRTKDPDALIAALKGAGLTPISVGGGAVLMRGQRYGVVRDPNNLFLTIEPLPAPRAVTPPAPTNP